MKQPTRLIPVMAGDDSQTGNARRQAMALGSSLDFSELRCGQLGIIVTEMARNLALHGGGGELLLTPWQHGGEAGLDVLSLDKGSGIPDVGAAMVDGYSTGGTAGNGLGAIERLAETFQLYSRPGKGTVVFARVLHDGEPAPGQQRSIREGAINLPLAGETVCGDGWDSHFETDRSVYIMADGLGHGPMAHDAAHEAVGAFRKNSHLAPKQILEGVHLALKKTRGAAVAIAEIQHDRKVLNYVGSGNIAASICGDGDIRSLVSMNGTPGQNMGRLSGFSYPWEAGALLMMHTDGLATRWSLNEYPGLTSRHPSLIAGVLFRDFSRHRDDATIMISSVQP